MKPYQIIAHATVALVLISFDPPYRSGWSR